MEPATSSSNSSSRKPFVPELGSHFNAGKTAITFRVFSARATRIELWIYAEPRNTAPIQTTQMQRHQNGTFRATQNLAALKTRGLNDLVYYGYRAWGPNWDFNSSWTPGSSAGFVSDFDAAGNRFNPNKLLLDPYALAVSGEPLSPEHPDTTVYNSGALSRMIDTGPVAPRGIVIAATTGDFGTKPNRAFKDEVVYEVHLRGLTKADPGVPAALQGTYAGAATRAAYLRDLGVTAVEFLPIHDTQNSLNDIPELAAFHNYWGYDSFTYFAPDRRYSSDQSPEGPIQEWIAMVKAFHDAGLKVYVDVVFNHHDESNVDSGGTVGEIFSLRGLDNASYYEILANNPGQYQNDNGVGPNVNAATTPVRNLVLASLRHWSDNLGVDGFRFDLAAVLGNSRRNGGYSFNRDDPDNILNRAVAELPARPAGGGLGVDLIAEPYTANSAGQEQGNFPRGWSEWNDRYRDAFRASQNKLGFVPVTPGTMATRFAGSNDLFGTRGRSPWNSVNYIACHDGMTLHDLYSYSAPNNNQPFPFGPSSGGRSAGDEMCWDHGGDSTQQTQALRTALAIIACSAGTPMIAGGSEFARTQSGNNNPFNLDTVANWLDWAAAGQQTVLTTFTRVLFRFRHDHACLRPADFFTGADHNANGVKDLTWYQDSGAEVSQDYFSNPDNHFLAFRLDGTEFGDSAPTIYVAYNGWIDPVLAQLPAPLHLRWHVAVDTSARSQPWGFARAPGTEFPVQNNQYLLDGRSVVVLLER